MEHQDQIVDDSSVEPLRNDDLGEMQNRRMEYYLGYSYRFLESLSGEVL